MGGPNSEKKIIACTRIYNRSPKSDPLTSILSFFVIFFTVNKKFNKKLKKIMKVEKIFFFIVIICFKVFFAILMVVPQPKILF